MLIGYGYGSAGQNADGQSCALFQVAQRNERTKEKSESSEL